MPLEPLLELEARVRVVKAERLLVVEPVRRGLRARRTIELTATAIGRPSKAKWAYSKKLVGRVECARQWGLRNGPSSHLARVAELTSILQ